MKCPIYEISFYEMSQRHFSPLEAYTTVLRRKEKNTKEKNTKNGTE